MGQASPSDEEQRHPGVLAHGKGEALRALHVLQDRAELGPGDLAGLLALRLPQCIQDVLGEGGGGGAQKVDRDLLYQPGRSHLLGDWYRRRGYENHSPWETLLKGGSVTD